MSNEHPSIPHPQLRREVGLWGAILMGLGSIVGTGVFVSIGIAAEVAGPAVLLAIALAAAVATANGLSSAQLAASHPVSGGTYEYGYRYLSPTLGFCAGWLFLCAKSASAATAALGFAGYLLHAMSAPVDTWLVPVAIGTVVVLTAIVLTGIRRSNLTNMGIVSLTLFSLTFFVLAGIPVVFAAGTSNFVPFFAPASGDALASGVLHATALMFVAYTGYGRIATLGEEVREPRRTIPRAIIATLVLSMALYVAVGFVAIGAVGAGPFAAATAETAAPLEVVAHSLSVPGARWILAAGAMTAMLGVLLNLILGLSRVFLAMGRRGDMPRALAGLDDSGTTPRLAVLLTGAVIAGLAMIGSVRTTWSFSAFTVLFYYALTNLAALRLPPESRRYPSWVAVAGLVACLFLAFWVEPEVWLAGLGLLAIGLLWHLVAQRSQRRARG